MGRRQILILISFSIVFLLFQNFTVPKRVLPIQNNFESHSANPSKRFRDYLKFRMGTEPWQKLERLKAKLRIDLSDKDQVEHSNLNDDIPKAEKQKDPMKYTMTDLGILRVRDQNTEVRCKVDSDGVNLVFQQQLNPSASYSIEHNTEQQKSQAKIQFSW